MPAGWPDSGFSFVELMINVLILGFLSVGLAHTFAIVMRTLPQAEAQNEDARSLMGLAIWLPEDLSSTPSARDDGTGPGGLDPDVSSPTGCAGASPGTNLLRARWSESIGDSTVTYLVGYRYVAKDQGFTVKRYSCIAGDSPRVMGMTGVLVESPICPPPEGDRLVEVDLVADADSAAGGAVFRVRVGCSMTEVRGISNKPDDELEARVPPPTTTVAATTTTVAAATTTVPAPTTTVPAATTTVPPCTGATITAISPNAPSNGPHEDQAELKQNLTITITSTGYCPSLGLIFDPWNRDGTPQTHVKWYSMQGATSITLLGSGGELWSDGVHTISLKHGVSSLTVLDTDTVEVS